MRKSTLRLLWICQLMLLTSIAHAGNWPRFRGPDGAGISSAKTVPTRFTVEDYNWRVRLPGPGHSSPIVWNDGIYLTCVDKSDCPVLIRIKGHDGAVDWQRRIEIDRYTQHNDNSFAATTPAADGQGVYLTYVSDGQRYVVAYDHDGQHRWQQHVGPFDNRHGAGASTIVQDGLIIVPNESMVEGSCITALNAADGSTRWRLDRAKHSKGTYVTPAVHRYAEGGIELIFAGTAHGITAVNPRQGTINWELPVDFSGDRCVSCPAVADGIILQIAGGNGIGRVIAAVRPKKTASSRQAETIYTTPQHLRRALPYVPSPIAVGPFVFLWTDTNAVITCIWAATGEQVWQQKVGGRYFSSPVCINGNLYNVSRAGELMVVAASDVFKELARVDLGEPTQASPAVGHGVLYLRTLNHLISVGGKG